MLGIFYHAFLGNVVAGNAPMLFASEDLGSLAEAVPPMSTVLSQWLIVLLLINAVVSTGIAIYIIRKLANPLLAIKRVLNEIGDGNLEARLRVGDSREFGELSEALNRALEQVHCKIKEARELTRVIDTLEDQPMSDDAALRTAMIRCRDVLSYFDARHAENDESSVNNAQSSR